MVERPNLARSPLADFAPRLAAGSIAGRVTLAELPIAGQLDLRGDPADPAFVAGTRAALGLALPLDANRVAIAGETSALWLGPDEWLVVTPVAKLRALEEQLGKELQGQHVAIVDVSASRTILDLAGPKARDVLMKGCGIDLDPGHFEPGHCVQTNLARVQVILQQVGGEPRYHLYARPSFTAYLAAWLLDAMAEYRAEPVAG